MTPKLCAVAGTVAAVGAAAALLLLGYVAIVAPNPEAFVYAAGPVVVAAGAAWIAWRTRTELRRETEEARR